MQTTVEYMHVAAPAQGTVALHDDTDGTNSSGDTFTLASVVLMRLHIPRTNVGAWRPKTSPYRPTGQSLHSLAEFAPVYGRYRPYGHGRHADADMLPVVSKYRPDPQAAQYVLSAPPRVESLSARPVVGPKRPEGQLEQSSAASPYGYETSGLPSKISSFVIFNHFPCAQGLHAASVFCPVCSL